MINLLKYHFKKKWVMLVVLSFAALLITLLTNTQNAYIHTYCVDWELNIWKTEAANPPITAATVIASVLATIIPFFEFSFKMKKINIDQYYSLPIKREKLYLTNYLFGLIEVLIPTTVSYLVGFVSIFTKPSMFETIYFLPYYFVLVLITVFLYTIITFVYTRNNTFIDGLVNVIMAAFSFCIIAATIENILKAFDLIDYSFDYLKGSWYIIYSPHTYLCDMFDQIICKGNLAYYKEDSNVVTISLVVFILVSIVCFALFYLFGKREKAEDCLQITNSYMSYRVMIPLYIVTATILLRSTNILAIALVWVAGFFFYVLYHRSFKLKLRSVITLIVCCAISLIAAIVLEEIDTEYLAINAMLMVMNL